MLFNSIDDFFHSLEHNTAIFRSKSFSISDDDNLVGGELLVTEKKENLLIATEKPGHEVNYEKSEQMFITCVENVEWMS